MGIRQTKRQFRILAAAWRRSYQRQIFLNSGLFFCNSTNAAPLLGDHSYTPFHLATVLEHHGNFSAAAKALAAQGYGTQRGADIPPEVVQRAITEAANNAPGVECENVTRKSISRDAAARNAVFREVGLSSEHHELMSALLEFGDGRREFEAFKTDVAVATQKCSATDKAEAERLRRNALQWFTRHLGELEAKQRETGMVLVRISHGQSVRDDKTGKIVTTKTLFDCLVIDLIVATWNLATTQPNFERNRRMELRRAAKKVVAQHRKEFPPPAQLRPQENTYRDQPAKTPATALAKALYWAEKAFALGAGQAEIAALIAKIQAKLPPPAEASSLTDESLLCKAWGCIDSDSEGETGTQNVWPENSDNSLENQQIAGEERLRTENAEVFEEQQFNDFTPETGFSSDLTLEGADLSQPAWDEGYWEDEPPSRPPQPAKPNVCDHADAKLQSRNPESWFCPGCRKWFGQRPSGAKERWPEQASAGQSKPPEITESYGVL